MRIQILPLPAVMVGDDLEEPFALVYDQAEEGVHKELLGEFARQCGAKTYVVVPQTVEIVDRYAEPEPAPVSVKMMDPVIKDAFPEKAADDMPWLTAGWPRLARDDRTVREEHLDGVPYLLVPEKAKDLLLEYGWTPPVEPVPGEPAEIAGLPVEVRHLVHAVDRLRDDWAEADADRRHNLWANVHAANERVWNRFDSPRAFDLGQRLQDAGEKARQALGIDGTMGDAQDVPHGYNDHAREAPYCVVCGLGQPARVHGPKSGQG